MSRSIGIGWGRHPDNGVCTVAVAYFPRRFIPNNKHPVWDYWCRYDQWQFVRGNCEVDWLTTKFDTPEAIYGYMADCGFSSTSEHIRAIREFARIEECDWARKMLAIVDADWDEA